MYLFVFLEAQYHILLSKYTSVNRAEELNVSHSILRDHCKPHTSECLPNTSPSVPMTLLPLPLNLKRFHLARLLSGILECITWCILSFAQQNKRSQNDRLTHL